LFFGLFWSGLSALWLKSNEEQLTHFRCLGRNIIYKYDNDLKGKLEPFQVMCRTINKT
jgi:hypothetical protein